MTGTRKRMMITNRESEKCSSFAYILKVEPTIFADIFKVGYKGGKGFMDLWLGCRQLNEYESFTEMKRTRRGAGLVQEGFYF